MDCYFHANVPSVARCADCDKAICATCRDQTGTCPSCRLAAKIESASAQRKSVAGEVPPRANQWWRSAAAEQAAQPAPRARASVAQADDAPESRALVALGYPLWPLAVLSLFDRKQSRRLRKNAYQAIGFNFGIYGLYALLALILKLPMIDWTPLGWGAGFLWALILPIFVVFSVLYGIRAWHGDDVHVPIISDWIDDRLPA